MLVLNVVYIILALSLGARMERCKLKFHVSFQR